MFMLKPAEEALVALSPYEVFILQSWDKNTLLPPHSYKNKKQQLKQMKTLYLKVMKGNKEVIQSFVSFWARILPQKG